MKLGKLTSRHLRLKGACAPQVNLFKAAFPDGFTPTKENFLKAGRVGLDVSWAGDTFLSEQMSSQLADDCHRRRWQTHADDFSFLKIGSIESYQVSYATVWWELIAKQLWKLRHYV